MISLRLVVPPAAPVWLEFPEGKDPFEILDRAMKR